MCKDCIFWNKNNMTCFSVENEVKFIPHSVNEMPHLFKTLDRYNYYMSVHKNPMTYPDYECIYFKTKGEND